MRRGTTKSHRPVDALLKTSLLQNRGATHFDPTNVVEVGSTGISGVSIGPLDDPLRSAGEERQCLPHHGEEVIVLEVFADLGLDLIVAQRDDGRNEDGV